MDWKLLSVIPPILMGVVMIVLLYGVGKAWKTNNKFLAIIYLVLAVVGGIAIYAIYGEDIRGWFQH